MGLNFLMEPIVFVLYLVSLTCLYVSFDSVTMVISNILPCRAQRSLCLFLRHDNSS
jgi:hypothetical protein